MIRTLDPETDLAAVDLLYTQAADYWLLADRQPHDRRKAAAFFTDGPPGCDPARSYRMGIFEGGDLAGVAELSFGFPEACDAYLGLMLLAVQARGKGLGKTLLVHLEELARQRGAKRIFLAVLKDNPKGRAFWQREGFASTGLIRVDDETGHRLARFSKDLQG
jgi:GNAT superfamily N-acetyltransferase